MIDQIVAEAIAQRIHEEAWKGQDAGKCAHELFPEITDHNDVARAVIESLVGFVAEGHMMWQAGLIDENVMVSTLEHGFIVAMAVGLEFGKVVASEDMTVGAFEFENAEPEDITGWN